MTYKDLYCFAAQCLALDTNPAFRNTIISNFTNGTIPLERFVALCDSHLILPAIFIKFRNHHLLEFIPNELSEHLETIYELNKKRNLELIRQAEQINSVLLSENISPVFLKGTGNLLDQLYSDPGERLVGDIDIIVEEKDYQKAIETIIAPGYSYEMEDFIFIASHKHFPRLFKNGTIGYMVFLHFN